MNWSLRKWQTVIKPRAFCTFARLPPCKLAGKTSLKRNIKKAVFARAKADLLPEFLTLSAREIHEGRELVQAQKSLLAESSFAIRRLKGKKRGKVWLL
uniref:head completion/stabilization protein n=1 Tax=Avibacterium paragallinarum TaxID=728 RepID=UPI0036F488E1